jgi:anhydro-N-acetylmuramic acid kinase
MDALQNLIFQKKSFDKDAEIAKSGTVNQELLTSCKSDSFLLHHILKQQDLNF